MRTGRGSSISGKSTNHGSALSPHDCAKNILDGVDIGGGWGSPFFLGWLSRFVSTARYIHGTLSDLNERREVWQFNATVGRTITRQPTPRRKLAPFPKSRTSSKVPCAATSIHSASAPTPKGGSSWRRTAIAKLDDNRAFRLF